MDARAFICYSMRMEWIAFIKENIYFIVVYFFIAFSFIINNLIRFLNHRKTPEKLPAALSDLMSAEEYEKNKRYNYDRTIFGAFSSVFSTTLLLLFITLKGFPFVDNLARSFQYGPIATGLIFWGIFFLANSIIGLPFSIYSTFVIEEKYGLNRTTPKTFVLDRIKGIFLTILIGGILGYAILAFFTTFPQMGWFYTWGFYSAFGFVMSILAPVIIMPLFNRFEPMPDGELKDKIEKYAKIENFKLKGIFTMDGSKRSTKLNAFFTGLGRFKRIVLFDTLIEKLDSNEILSVLAHEMGHFKKKHILISMFFSLVQSFFMFYLLSLFITNENLFQVFYMENISIYGGIIFFTFLFAPIEMLTSFFGNAVSRKHEYEADAYASSSTGNAKYLISSLKKLSTSNLSRLIPSKLDVIFNYSHPPLIERIDALNSIHQS